MNISACLACAAGYYCENESIAVIDIYACAPGYYCPEGTYSPIPCPAGTYRYAVIDCRLDSDTASASTFSPRPELT